MNIRYVFILSSLLASSLPCLSAHEETYRTFTAPDGRTLEARILEHSSRTGKVQIERDNKKKDWVSPKAFIDADQDYIRQWIKVDQFMSSSKFKISGDPDKGKTGSKRLKKGRRDEKEELTPLIYTITLENRTDFPLQDIRIEYLAFIEVNGYEGRKDRKRIVAGSLQGLEISAGEKIEVETKTVQLVTSYETVSEFSSSTGSYTTYDKVTSRDRLKGFWVKIFGPECDGASAVRNWCYPADTMDDFEWKDIPKTANSQSSQAASEKNRNDLGISPSSLARSDPEKALQLMKEDYEESKDPEVAKNIGYTYLWLLEPHDIGAGLEWLKKGAADDNESACRLLSGFYSTYYGHTNYLDVEQAVFYGMKALSIRTDNFPHITMALAYARSGQFDEAVEHQQTAIEIEKDWIEEKRKKLSSETVTKMEQNLEKMQHKLELYKNKQVE